MLDFCPEDRPLQRANALSNPVAMAGGSVATMLMQYDMCSVEDNAVVV